jgi:hypothetical protein
MNNFPGLIFFCKNNNNEMKLQLKNKEKVEENFGFLKKKFK